MRTLPVFLCLLAIVSSSQFEYRVVRRHYAHVAVVLPWLHEVADSVSGIDSSIVLHASICPNLHFYRQVSYTTSLGFLPRGFTARTDPGRECFQCFPDSF
ncbi:hypothetical protein OCU04_005363 [Sclerotinia nivalis]|uniref:Secreted protein n=1 Tax=Sclerotinia nivalis TaxID=352851 RepID=A0A9X0ANZ3_9HELO|nr:hypothetical protein OCU04_005363 [Sclerotinia nivalis]